MEKGHLIGWWSLFVTRLKIILSTNSTKSWSIFSLLYDIWKKTDWIKWTVIQKFVVSSTTQVVMKKKQTNSSEGNFPVRYYTSRFEKFTCRSVKGPHKHNNIYHNCFDYTRKKIFWKTTISKRKNLSSVSRF